MTELAGQAIKKANFKKEVMEIHLGRMKVLVDFKSCTVAATKDDAIVDKFNFEKSYSLDDFGKYIDRVIQSENKLGGLYAS